MPVFVNWTDNYLLISNYKVMSTSLKYQANLQILNSRLLKRIIFAEKCRFSICRTEKVMIVRNPYSRLTSFFEDKFRRHPNASEIERIKYGDDRGWQKSQKIFFPYLGINLSQQNDEIKFKLLTTSFNDFIEILPNVYNLDLHLRPQVEILNVSLLRFNTKIQPDKILRLENLEADLDYIKNRLKLDLNIRQNRSKYLNHVAQYLNPINCEIIHSLYENDFDYLKYEKLNSASLINKL